jgi:NitT/TauT family transport system ATP-binding protein
VSSQPHVTGAGAIAAHAEPVVVLDHVSKTYMTDEGPVEAIADVSGTIPEGRFVALIGASGSGKTTLLDIVAGLQRASGGRVLVDGEEVRAPRRELAMVFQEDSTLHWRSVLDNVAFGLEVAGMGAQERRRRAAEMIRLVGLDGFERQRPGQLSGGMKQRVAIARALVMRPRILLMDEPFGALDQQTRTVVGGELLRIWEETRPSILFVTHDINEAVYLADEVWVLSSRPARRKAVVEIDLQRPRGTDTLRSQRFHALTGELWGLIADEAREAGA